MTPAVIVAVLVCGGIAAVARYLAAVWLAPAAGFPWAVLVVNAAGSALGGTVLALGVGLGDEARLILLSGVAGGLTTFSTFSVETIQLWVDGRARAAALNVAANLGVGLTVTAAGYLLVSALTGMPG